MALCNFHKTWKIPSSPAEVESLPGEPREPHHNIALTIENGDNSSSPAEIDSITSEQGEPDDNISFPVKPEDASEVVSVTCEHGET